MTPRQEIFHVPNGTGAIEVRGNRMACGVFLHGKAVTLNWHDRGGSIGQEALLYSYTAKEAQAFLDRLTLRAPEAETTLEAALAPLLKQLTTGTYELLFGNSFADGGLIDWWGDAAQEQLSYYPFSYYPCLDNIVATQPDEKINDDRVLEYMELIDGGARPFIISATVPDAWCEFLLDGHHKLRAYYHLGIPPSWLRVTSLTAKSLTADDWPTGEAPPNFLENLTPNVE